MLAKSKFVSDAVKHSTYYYLYDVVDGETPEDVANKFYDDPTKHWIVLMANEMVDPQYDWTLSTNNFQKYINNKYSSLNIYLDSQNYSSANVNNLVTYSSSFDNAAWSKYQSFIPINLLTYSQEFGSWTLGNVSISPNVIAAPDGTTTADKIVENTSSGVQHLTYQTITVVAGAVYTYSVYAKAAEWTSFQMQMGTSGALGTFNLSTVTATKSGSATSATITAVTGAPGWYRCVLVAPAIASGTMYIYKTSSTYTGDGASGIYVWGAQVVRGAVPGDYKVTTSTSLPLVFTAPDSTITAQKLISNITNGFHTLYQTVSVTAGSTYAYSIYAKAAELSRFNLECIWNDASITASYNLSNNDVSSSGAVTANMISVGNGWYRCSIIFTVPSGKTDFSARVVLRDNSGNAQYTGDDFSGLYIWGTQVVLGSAPDNVIPYQVGETVYQGISYDQSSVEATVVNYDYMNKILQVKFPSQVIANSANIIGLSSNLSHTVVKIVSNDNGMNWAQNTLSYYRETQTTYNNLYNTVVVDKHKVSANDYKQNTSTVITRDMSGSTKQYSLADGTVVINTMIEPISYYQDEIEINDAKRQIKVIRPDFIPLIEQEFIKLMGQ